MSYSLNSLKGGYIGEYYRVIKGDTRSLDSSSHGIYLGLKVGIWDPIWALKQKPYTYMDPLGFCCPVHFSPSLGFRVKDFFLTGGLLRLSKAVVAGFRV